MINTFAEGQNKKGKRKRMHFFFWKVETIYAYSGKIWVVLGVGFVCLFPSGLMVNTQYLFVDRVAKPAIALSYSVGLKA